jgi:HEAT repeat protein/cyclophilin family peptidyl-prolyl cis-trans isomerase
MNRIVPLLLAVALVLSAAPRKTLTAPDLEQIAELLFLEDGRRFDEGILSKALRAANPEVRRRAAMAVGRIADERGKPLLVPVRSDPDQEVKAAVAFAAGQLKDEASVEWLAEVLLSPQSASRVSQQAARSLGKIQTTTCGAALAKYLLQAPMKTADAAVVGEALLAFGRVPGKLDLAPMLRWMDSPIADLQWRVGWAFRNRDAQENLPHLLQLSKHPNAELRAWVARKLAAPAGAATRLLEMSEDSDRRVQAEAIRALSSYGDDASFARVLAALDSKDTWVASFAAEGLGRYPERTSISVPKLVEASQPTRGLGLRLAILPVLRKLSPEQGKSLADALPTPPARTEIPTRPPRTLVECRRIVKQWVLPDYLGKPRPRVIWQTSKGVMELELYAGDAPLATDYLVELTNKGNVDGTEFGRVVPNFVAQQRPIRGVNKIRDEVHLRPLTRGNLSWATSGLDTGPPGYTLGVGPMPHIEGSFTALGRVVLGLDVMDQLELGDSVVRARMR